MARWIEDIVQINPYSRPGEHLDSVDAVVMHWTGNPGASDENHANFFDGADGGGGRYASAHLFGDRDSTTLIIPLSEMAYHANDVQKHKPDGSPYRGVTLLLPNANRKSIGYEMCVERDGTIHPDTVKKAVKDVAELCRMFKLDPSVQIVRHFDVTAKNCPAPWVKDPLQFVAFKSAVAKEMGVVVKPTAPKPTAPKSSILLKVGSKGAQVVLAQSKLGIKADGVFGSGTETAVRAFQKAMGLKVDGVIGSVTWAKLQEVSPPKKATPPKPVEKDSVAYPGEVLRKGSQGKNVGLLQSKLKAKGAKSLKVDNDFGTNTEIAVKAFQKANGLEDDGEVGKLTWSKLF